MFIIVQTKDRPLSLHNTLYLKGFLISSQIEVGRFKVSVHFKESFKRFPPQLT